MKLFKDMYRKANDSIPTDEAKMRVMARLEKPAAVRPYKRIAEISALAACLVFTFAAVSIYHRFEEGRNQENISVPLVQPGIGETVKVEYDLTENGDSNMPEAAAEKQRAAEEVKKPVEKAAPKAKPAENKPSETVTPDLTEEKSAAKEGTAADAAQAVESAAKEIAPQEIETAIVVNESKPASGGGSSAAALYARDAQPMQELTLSEYYGYLGKNIEECAELPEGFECITQDAVFLKTDENGNYTSDEWSFVYQKEEKVVDITTTKNTETVQSYIGREDYLKSTVCGIDAVVIKDGEHYRAYMAADEIGYTVTAFGLEEAEIEGLLVSLVK